MKEASELLENGLKELSITYTSLEISAFLTYLEELKKWNRAHNLTGLKTDRDIIIKHFLDSLLFIKVLPDNVRTVADVGSGAGFPGIPMKIVNPLLEMFLIEPSQKKAIFLRHICSKLGLKKIEIINKRIEHIDVLRVDAAVTRALFSISDFIRKAEGILHEKGILILNKGPKLEEEIQKILSKKISVKDLKLPFEDIIRHMVIVKTYL
ncbi:MAG: 16S rRNA (guanine(527)-N(7))-methyltransferase RsmG [Nitrospirota bacterium]